MDLVEETHEVSKVGICIDLSANSLGGGFYGSRPCSWDIHASVEAVRGNLVSDEILECFRICRGNSDPCLGPSAGHSGNGIPQCLPLFRFHVSQHIVERI